ncbi:alpha/beta hydrolase [Streptomyces prunicolor]|uniref:Alpha/beta hydrolase fold domain-containing protein n=1 Tax=Streptomyces prunicolor TaxID=67348 RepID=A0ABU4FD34_9ACTN|nr:alpha/beta hydrolase fold domain-containing protein [Streptomyces prunicolor]MDV7217943.1 alpha/beta hydrolase fold domain-containing protein [Streptomyces prunicolor]
MGGERTADRSRFPALIRHRGRSPSRRFADHTTLVLPGHRVRGFFANAFPGHDDEQLLDPSLSPLFAKLENLPPALFTVGTLDPLLDDSLFMSARWWVAGNRADLDVWPDGVHGFSNVVPKTGHAVVEGISSWFNARLSA